MPMMPGLNAEAEVSTRSMPRPEDEKESGHEHEDVSRASQTGVGRPRRCGGVSPRELGGREAESSSAPGCSPPRSRLVSKRRLGRVRGLSQC